MIEGIANETVITGTGNKPSTKEDVIAVLRQSM